MHSRNLPPAFTHRIIRQLDSEADEFFFSIRQSAPVSIRVHPRKFPTVHDWQKSTQVLWCRQGYYLPKRPVFTLDPLFHAGAYYVQEASSMFLYQVLEQILPSQKENVKVLDLCAAPGGKSTIILSFLNGAGLLISNEVIRSRIPALKENIIRWGYDNAIITNNDPEDFVRSKLLFDLVVVDAPCSGEGLFRKDPDSINEWSVENTHFCAMRQKRILASATKIVSEGGFLIYSTCTYNPAENESHRQQIIESGFESVAIAVNLEWNITQPCSNSVQFFPHKNEGEGFYLSVFSKIAPTDSEVNLRKKNKIEVCNPESFKSLITLPENRSLIRGEKFSFTIFPNRWTDWLGTAANKLQIIQAGTAVAEIKGKDVIPSHALALSFFHSEEIKKIEIDEHQARLFLSKESIPLTVLTPKGFVLLVYRDTALGWIKNLGNRTNNLYPQEYRIRLRWK